MDIKLNFNTAVVVLLVLQVFLSFQIVSDLNEWDERWEERQSNEERDLVRPCHYGNCCYQYYAYDTAESNDDEHQEEEERQHEEEEKEKEHEE